MVKWFTLEIPFNIIPSSGCICLFKVLEKNQSLRGSKRGCTSSWSLKNEPRCFGLALCYLGSVFCVTVWVSAVGLIKSLVITSSFPNLRTQRWTVRRTFCNLRSRARRCGLVRTGRNRSVLRDSIITSLNLNSDWARSCSLSSVERFILKKKKKKMVASE